jgi:hypothetical protein
MKRIGKGLAIEALSCISKCPERLFEMISQLNLQQTKIEMVVQSIVWSFKNLTSSKEKIRLLYLLAKDHTRVELHNTVGTPISSYLYTEARFYAKFCGHTALSEDLPDKTLFYKGQCYYKCTINQLISP